MDGKRTLTASEEMFAKAFQYCADAIGIIRLDNWEYVEVNEAFTTIFGYERREIIGENSKQIELWANVDERNEFFRNFQGRQELRNIETNWCTKFGEIRKGIISAAKIDIGGEEYGVYVWHDTTEKKKAEEELNFRNILLSTQQEVSLDGILIVDANNVILSANKKFFEIWQIPRELFEERRDELVLNFVMNQLVDPPSFLQKVHYLYENQQATSQDELALKGGRFLDRYSAPMFGEKGEYFGRVWFFRDITGRKVAEAKLKKEQSFTDSVLDSIPGMLYLYDEQGRLVRWNKQHQEMTGYSSEELSHMTLLDWYKGDEETQERIMQAVRRAQKEGFVDTEADLQKKDGTKIPMYLTAVTLEREGKQYITGIGIDITKRKQMEDSLRQANEELEGKVELRTQELMAMNEELTAMNGELTARNEELFELNEKLQMVQNSLIQAEKMAALARLVAGMAHEMNTPLGICVTLSSHLEQITKEFSKLFDTGIMKRAELEEFIEECCEASHLLLINTGRAANLVNNFKQVSVDQASEVRRVFGVKEYLDEILVTLTSKLQNTGHKVQISCDEKIYIHGYPGALSQILINLIVNSLTHGYDAGQEGIITIIVEQVGDDLVMTYKDNGKGIDEDVLAKIFDPFFTTRRNQGGTGLGLSIVYNLVTQLYAGKIECFSQIGEGVTFRIRIPSHLIGPIHNDYR